jgi:hypothetical protein
MVSLVDSSCQNTPETKAFEQMFAPSQEEVSMATDFTRFEEAFTNTNLVEINEIGV